MNAKKQNTRKTITYCTKTALLEAIKTEKLHTEADRIIAITDPSHEAEVSKWESCGIPTLAMPFADMDRSDVSFVQYIKAKYLIKDLEQAERLGVETAKQHTDGSMRPFTTYHADEIINYVSQSGSCGFNWYIACGSGRRVAPTIAIFMRQFILPAHEITQVKRDIKLNSMVYAILTNALGASTLL